MSDPTERPLPEDQRDVVSKAGAPLSAAAGAIAGAVAGLSTLALGPIGIGVGAVLGALGGATVGGAASQAIAGTYTTEHDEHYQALWENTPGRLADASFDRVRPAYQLGHLAAAHESYVNRDFDTVEPTLRAAWERDFGTNHGDWNSARRHVRDAFGHARSEGFGIRRDASVIGTGGSAVDPVELARVRDGLPSRDDFAAGTVPVYPTDLVATSPNAEGPPYGAA